MTPNLSDLQLWVQSELPGVSTAGCIPGAVSARTWNRRGLLRNFGTLGIVGILRTVGNEVDLYYYYVKWFFLCLLGCLANL